MKRRPRRTFLVSLSALAVPLVVAAVAWACVPTANMVLRPSSGPVGTTVLADGNGFQPGTTIHLRWNHADHGQQLATTVADASGSFRNVSFAIPHGQACRVHFVIARGVPDTSHAGTHNAAETPFEIRDSSCGRSSTPPPPTTSSRRARAIRTCKRRRYRGSRRTVQRKRAACIRRAKRRYPA